MAIKFAKAYQLQSNSVDTNGRPCWVQKVSRSKDLYICLQACKPCEKLFPYVQSLLVSVSPEGELTEYGSGKVLARITEVTLENGEARGAIMWIDGTNVVWISESS